jgi:sugar lactone lactonase YvrE
MTAVGVLLSVFLSASIAGLPWAPAVHASGWTRGDLVVGVSGGSYQIRDASGVLKETITGPFSGSTTGCAFNNDLTRLYTTFFDVTKVVAFDFAHPHGAVQTIDAAATSPGGHSESVTFAANGHYYVGHPDGNKRLHEYDGAGNLVTTFAIATDDRGTDWEDLTVDQSTLFYTSEGRRILRFNVATNSQLADFANLGAPAGQRSYAIRLLEPRDGSGGLLVADTVDVKRLDGAGNVVQTYDAPGEDTWFALTLDPDGTSFWSANFGTSNVYKFDIASGAQLLTFNTGTGSLTVLGLCQMEDRPPVALCQDRTVSADGTCHASASVDNGSFDPDTPLFGDTITLSQSPAPPYPLGSTGVTLTVTDNIGKSAECKATVTVIDTTPPDLVCSANQVLECTGPGGAAAVVGATATDNCSVAAAPVCVPPSGTFPIGSTTVTCTASDGSSNTGSCQSTVKVVDTTAPVVSCVPSFNPSGKNVPAASGLNEDGYYKVSATDVCTVAPTLAIGGIALANGETIKITQSPGFSGVRLINTAGPAAIKHIQVGPGDAVIAVTDANGNVGTATCLVPPPPK